MMPISPLCNKELLFLIIQFTSSTWWCARYICYSRSAFQNIRRGTAICSGTARPVSRTSISQGICASISSSFRVTLLKPRPLEYQIFSHSNEPSSSTVLWTLYSTTISSGSAACRISSSTFEVLKRFKLIRKPPTSYFKKGSSSRRKQLSTFKINITTTRWALTFSSASTWLWLGRM